jgi:hypothetical protein
MRILEYIGLDTRKVSKAYQKVTQAIAAGDFRAAQVKKLANLGHGKFYRARLDDADRLLFSLVRHGDEVCALMLEVIAGADGGDAVDRDEGRAIGQAHRVGDGGGRGRRRVRTCQLA